MNEKEYGAVGKSRKPGDYRARWVLFGILLAGFVLDAIWVMRGDSQNFDNMIRDFAYGLRTPAGDVIFVAITQMASAKWIIAWIAVLLIIPKTRTTIGLPQGLTQLATFGLYKILKPAFARPRPNLAMWLVQEHGFSFPSGHSMNGFFFYYMLLFLLRRRITNPRLKTAVTVILGVMPFLVAFTRVYVGVHYFSDVCGGLLVGAACFVLSTIVLDEVAARRPMPLQSAE